MGLIKQSSQTDPNLENVRPAKGNRRRSIRSSGQPPARGSATALAPANSQDQALERTDPWAAVSTRRQRRATSRLVNLLLIIIVGPSSLLLSAMIYVVHAEYSWIQSQVDAKEAQLAAIKSQYELGQHRLAALKSDKGREEILVEHGYIRPGDRILLFPATRDEQRAALIPKNDLSPHPPITGTVPSSGSAPSAWRRAGNVIQGWWQALRAGAGIEPADEQPAKTGEDTPETSMREPKPTVSSLKAGEPATSKSVVAKPQGLKSVAPSKSEKVAPVHAKPTVAPTSTPGTGGTAAGSAAGDSVTGDSVTDS